MFEADDFVSDVPVEREVTLRGKPRKVHFRELSRADWFRFLKAYNSEDLDVKAGAAAFLISKGICDPDGSTMPIEKAATIKSEVQDVLVSQWLEWRKEQREAWGNDSGPGATSGSGTT